MQTPQALAERYASLWNEPDSNRRRQEIASLWTEAGSHYVKALAVSGHDALEVRIRDSHDKNVRDRGNRFRVRQDAQRLRDLVTFSWEMVSGSGAAVLAVGLEVLHLDSEGRIAADYQFIQPQ